MMLRTTAIFCILLCAINVDIASTNETPNPSKTYLYNYTTGISLRQLGHPSEVNTGHTVTSQVEITPLTLNNGYRLLQIQAPLAPRIARKTSKAKLMRTTAILVLNGGQVERIFVDAKLSTVSINILKGIGSLLNVNDNYEDGIEIDSSGECNVKYEKSGTAVIKRKSDCKNTENTFEIRPGNALFETEKTFTSSTQYQMNEENMITEAEGHEKVTLALSLLPNMGVTVSVEQSLRLQAVHTLNTSSPQDKSFDEVILSAVGASQEVHLGPTLETSLAYATTEELVNLLDQVKSALRLEKLASLPSAQAFAQLIPVIRGVYNTDQLDEVISSDDYSDIYHQLLDLLASCQTGPCLQVLFKHLNFSETDKVDIHERILFSLSYLRSPSEKIVAAFLEKMQSTKKGTNVNNQAIQTLGTLIGRLARRFPNSTVVADVLEFLSSTLEKCSSEDCILTTLSAIQNSNHSFFIDRVMQVAKDKRWSSVAHSAALKTLSKLFTPDSVTDHRVQQKVRKFVNMLVTRPQLLYDSSVHLLLINVLLQFNGTLEDYETILIFIQSNPHVFIPTFQKFLFWCDVKLVEEKVCQAIKRNTLINNWNTGASKTFSSFIYGSLAHTAHLNADFQLDLLSTSAGIMKLSNMDVSLVGVNGESKVVSVGLFANGLASMANSDTKEEGDTTAGMTLGVFDSGIRPIRFFTGTTELMAAAWNAPSTPTPALQGIQLPIDYSTCLYLQNGQTVRYVVIGAVSLDLSGALELSLWNRNSKSLVRTAGALSITSGLEVNFTQSSAVRMEDQVEGEGKIDFGTHVDFSGSPIRMCLHMQRLQILLQRKVTKTTQQTGKKDKVRTTRSSFTLPGVSYNFGYSNNDLCRSMIPSEGEDHL